MDGSIRKHTPRGEVHSLNLDDLNVEELERRLEMAVANTAMEVCVINRDCNCPSRSSCGTFCS